MPNLWSYFGRAQNMFVCKQNIATLAARGTSVVLVEILLVTDVTSLGAVFPVRLYDVPDVVAVQTSAVPCGAICMRG